MSLSRARERELIHEAQAGDPAAMVALTDDHLPLIKSIARTYGDDETLTKDLVQQGILGVIRAVERFEARGRRLTVLSRIRARDRLRPG